MHAYCYLIRLQLIVTQKEEKFRSFLNKAFLILRNNKN